MKGKVKVTISLLFVMLFLCGCDNAADTISEVEDYLENKAIGSSLISTDPEYTQYEDLKASGLIDEETNEIIQNTDGIVDESGIQVTIAKNNHMNVRCYRDEKLSDEILTTTFYVNPGETVYGENEISNSSSNLYEFKEYKIYTINSEGEKVEAPDLQSSQDNIIISVPTDFNADNKIVVEPLGYYKQSEVVTSVYLLNDNNIKDNISETSAGVWYLNGEKINGTSTTVSPTEPYSLSCDYDEDTYFVYESDGIDSKGKILYEQTEASTESREYSVTLHRYISLKFSCKGEPDITLNGVDDTDNLKNGIYSNQKLKFGDTLVVTTSDTLKLDTLQYVEVKDEQKIANDKNRYTLHIANNYNANMEIALDYTTKDYEFTLDCESIDGRKIKNENWLLDDAKSTFLVDTTDAVNISSTGKELGEGKAFRLIITRTDGDENEYVETRYVEKKLNNIAIPVKLASKPSVQPQNVKVVIGIKDVESVVIPSIENATVQLKYCDTGDSIKNGSLIDDDREVILYIKPNKGYTLTESKNMPWDSTHSDNGYYENTMKYSEYKNSISGLIKRITVEERS